MQERREIEKALFNGDILAVAATNALELGLDVGSLDLTMHLGFQGKEPMTPEAHLNTTVWKVRDSCFRMLEAQVCQKGLEETCQ